MAEEHQQSNTTPPASGAGSGQAVGDHGLGNTSASDNKKVMSVLAYVGPLVIVSYLVAKDDPDVKFHIRQGLVLLSIEVAMWFLGTILIMLWFVFELINLAAFILSIVGIVNAVNGKQKELPVVGQYSKYFNGI